MGSDNNDFFDRSSDSTAQDAERDITSQERGEESEAIQQLARETTAVDQATYEPEATVELEGDYQQSEEIEQAFVEIVDAPEAAMEASESAEKGTRQELIGPEGQPPLEIGTETLDKSTASEEEERLDEPFAEAEVQIGEVRDPTNQAAPDREVVIPIDEESPEFETGGADQVIESKQTVVVRGVDQRGGLEDQRFEDAGYQGGVDSADELIPDVEAGGELEIGINEDSAVDPNLVNSIAHEEGLSPWEDKPDLESQASVGADPRVGSFKTVVGKIWAAIGGTSSDKGSGGGTTGVRGTPVPDSYEGEEFDHTAGGLLPDNKPTSKQPINKAESMMQPVGEEDTRLEGQPKPITFEDAMAGAVDPYAYWDGEQTSGGFTLGETKTVDTVKPGEELLDPPEVLDGTDGGVPDKD